MDKTKKLIEVLESSFAEGSTRRVVGKLLITSEQHLAIRDIVNIAGLTQGQVTSSLDALRNVFTVNTVITDKLQHHKIQASDTVGVVDTAKLLNDAFKPSTPEGYNVNGYFKGIGYGSIQL